MYVVSDKVSWAKDRLYEVRGHGLWEYDRGNVDNEGIDTQTAGADCMDGTRGLDFSRL